MINSPSSPSLHFSLRYFFHEVFRYTQVTADVIETSVFSLTSYRSLCDLNLILHELSRCFIETRVHEEESARRELIKTINSKITQTKQEYTHSYSQLCSMYSLLTVYFFFC